MTGLTLFQDCRKGCGRIAEPGSDLCQQCGNATPTVPYCLFQSPTRGLAARQAEFEAWRAQYGNFGCAIFSHAWHSGITFPSQPTETCQATVMWCDIRDDRRHSPGKEAPECGCWDIDAFLYRGACTHCDWEGPDRNDENSAAEDALDHSHPGWRDLPIVKRTPEQGTSKAQVKALKAWKDAVDAVYPPGWLAAGGPIRTTRTGGGSRHVPMATPDGGYDVCVPASAKAARP